jgi:Mrp family chromosome partitioning ATPase
MDLGMIRDVRVNDNWVRFTVVLPFMNVPIKDQIVSEARAAVEGLPGVKEVDVELAEMTQKERTHFMAAQEKRVGLAERFNRIQHVIAVVSGKGGVGKSLVAGLLAVALKREDHQVGVLDADITGPSIPKMFFPTRRHPGNSPLGIVPVESETGIKVMSINLLLPSEDEAVIWRGPLISTAIKQFWGDVVWGDLDCLIVDLPPGTADASLTVMQAIPLDGVVLVTSPQDLAAMVVKKAASMARTMGVPILGIVENMSYVVCPDTGRRLEVFGPSKGGLRLGGGAGGFRGPDPGQLLPLSYGLPVRCLRPPCGHATGVAASGSFPAADLRRGGAARGHSWGHFLDCGSGFAGPGRICCSPIRPGGQDTGDTPGLETCARGGEANADLRVPMFGVWGEVREAGALRHLDI